MHLGLQRIAQVLRVCPLAALEMGGAPWRWCERKSGWVKGSGRLVRMVFGGFVFERRMMVVEMISWRVEVLGKKVQKMELGWEWRLGWKWVRRNREEEVGHLDVGEWKGVRPLRGLDPPSAVGCPRP